MQAGSKAKQPYNVKIKDNHKKAFKEYNKNGFVISRALKDTGFAPTIVKSPSKVTTTRSWQMLVKQYLPDELKASKHNQLLNSKNENIAIKALESAYKLEEKGGYSKERAVLGEGKVISITNILNILNPNKEG